MLNIGNKEKRAFTVVPFCAISGLKSAKRYHFKKFKLSVQQLLNLLFLRLTILIYIFFRFSLNFHPVPWPATTLLQRNHQNSIVSYSNIDGDESHIMITRKLERYLIEIWKRKLNFHSCTILYASATI